jgi:serine/threonine protein kinase
MAANAPGLQIGPYTLLARVGAGGMGEVWRARDNRLNRVVAIKFPNAEFSQRFQREARAIAALSHPNVATIYDVGPNYLVMEYVEGEPLRQPADIRKLLETAVQIADGLTAAHTTGIVHRDLKPDNVLVGADGRVKILDFGLAKQATTAADETQTVTAPGMIVGTVAYMSPEQARGAEVDFRSDQFSLGIILYELACGKRPFQRSTTAETIAAIIRDDPPPLPSTVPTPLRWTIERCLAKEAGDRYASTADLYRDLKLYAEHLPEISRMNTELAGMRREAPRNRKWCGSLR